MFRFFLSIITILVCSSAFHNTNVDVPAYSHDSAKHTQSLNQYDGYHKQSARLTDFPSIPNQQANSKQNKQQNKKFLLGFDYNATFNSLSHTAYVYCTRDLHSDNFSSSKLFIRLRKIVI